MEQSQYGARESGWDAALAATAPQPQSLLQRFFSFEGRMRRGQFWGHSFAWLFLTTGLLCFYMFVLRQGARPTLPSSTELSYVTTALSLPWWWGYTALAAKRLHDRNRSAWWVLLQFVPVANVWLAIELGFQPGMPGPNRYGPPPP